MNSTKTLFILLIILFPLISFSQSLKEADNAFKYEQYATASQMYAKAYSKTKNKDEKKRIMFQIAECYRLTKNEKKAEQQYRRVIKAGYSDPIATFYLGEVLRDQEKYQEAIEQFKAYSSLAPSDPRGPLGVKSCENAIDWAKNPTSYEVENMVKINGKDDDFSPAYADKKYSSIVFTSSRSENKSKIDPNTGLGFTSLFITQKDVKNNWSKPVPLDTKGIVNTPNENNGAVTFNKKFNAIYFTRCGVQKKAIVGCGIYTSSQRGKEWADPKLLPIANDSMRVGHPAISGNEKELYFVSTLENGLGGKDIWVAKRRKRSDDFGKPENLGPNINSSGDELYPTIRETSDGHTYLYFASNGRGGMGGFDIFRSELIDGKWTEAENLEAPINSSGDDFGIIFSNARKFEKTLSNKKTINCEEMGYFTSNRDGGRGRFDIWEFWLPEVAFSISGNVKDENTLQYISGAQVQINGSDGTVLSTTADNKGYYTFTKDQIAKNTTYTLEASKKGYFKNSVTETTVGRKKSEDIMRNINITPIPKAPISLPEIRYDLADWKLKTQYQDSLNGLIETMKNNPTIVIELSSHTDYRDSDERNDTLSYKRAKEVVDYLATKGIDPDRMVPKGYGEKQPRTLVKDYTFTSGEYKGVKFPAGTKLTEEYITKKLKTNKEQEAANQLNRRTEFRIIRDDYVPKNSNDSINSSKRSITINPNDNQIPYTIKNDSMIASCIINDVTYQFAFVSNEPELKISLSTVMDLIKQHKLDKNNFDNIEEAFTEDGTVKPNEKFTIPQIRIGNRTLYDQSAICVHGQPTNVVLGTEVLSDFSSFNIDKTKKIIIFE